VTEMETEMNKDERTLHITTQYGSFTLAYCSSMATHEEMRKIAEERVGTVYKIESSRVFEPIDISPYVAVVLVIVRGRN